MDCTPMDCSTVQDLLFTDSGDELVMESPKEIIYKVRIGYLVSFLTPMHAFYLKNNRQLDMDRVVKMSDAHKASYMKSGHCPIQFTLIKLGQHADFINDHNSHGLVIVDGQHRLAVLESLMQQNPDILSGKFLLVSVYRGQTRQDILDYFRDVNNNWEPVPMLNLDDGINVVVKNVGEWFLTHFSKKMFSEKDRCLGPMFI